MSTTPAQVVVVGGGFAGLHALRRLERLLPSEAAELILVNPTDHLVYSPLLPDVVSSNVEPRHIAVSIRQVAPRTRLLLGHALSVDRANQTVDVKLHQPTGQQDAVTLSWDRLLLAPGSVTRRFPIPGVDARAHGVKTLAEAQFLRDHLLTQLDIADSLPPGPSHDAERRERMTVVAVGAGYTGTEVVAQTHHWLGRVASRWSRLELSDVRWVLVDLATAVLPELGPGLGDYALSVLRRRGIDVRLGVSVSSVTERTITLTDGTVIPSRNLIWSAGVVGSPLIATLGCPTEHGRLLTDAKMRVQENVWAVGDAAAIPDLTQPTAPGQPAPVTAPTAQHAQRQGNTVAYNIAASLGHARSRRYRHKDLGLVGDLGGSKAVAKPLGIELTGIPAKAVARGYHLLALPCTGNRLRVLTDWLLGSVLAPQTTGLVSSQPQIARAPRTPPAGIHAEPSPQPSSRPAR